MTSSSVLTASDSNMNTKKAIEVTSLCLYLLLSVQLSLLFGDQKTASFNLSLIVPCNWLFSSSQNVLPSRFCVCFFILKHLLKQMKQLCLSYLNTLVFLRNIRTETYSSLGMQTDQYVFTLWNVSESRSQGLAYCRYWDAIPECVGGQLKSMWDERCIKWFFCVCLVFHS